MANPVARIGGLRPGAIAGAAEFQQMLRDYPAGVVQDCRAALEETADDLVNVIKDAAPVSPLEKHPGELKDSVHKENGGHDLSILVVEDARDEKGEPYPAHVEYGHKARDGSHVPAEPHFWPAVRGARRKLQAKLRARMKSRAAGLTQ